MDNFKRLIRYLRPYRYRVAIAVLLMFGVTLSAIPLPLFQKEVLDVAIPNKDEHLLVLIFFGVIALYAVRGLVSYSLNYLIGWLGQRVIFDLRFQSYRHLQRLVARLLRRATARQNYGAADRRHRHHPVRA